MKKVPSYPKVLILGASYTENALTGEVILQEKVDGSQFGFGLNEDNELVFRSHNSSIQKECIPSMFKGGVEYLLTIEEKIKAFFSPDTYFYCEYLRKPKHNVLKYDRFPKHHLVLFDVLIKEKWVDREELCKIAEYLDIDMIPELYRGKADIDKIKELLNIPSFLGNELIEGVVIKNYNLFIEGSSSPLFTKYVRETFKERSKIDQKDKESNKQSIEEYIKSFHNEARWQKAYLHLLEQDKIEKQPKDIQKLINAVKKDIIAEEKENIKKDLYKMFIGKILDYAIKGLPEWYKNKLVQDIVQDIDNTI
ncbi:MAG TPA: RNA ligase family protein [Candidatus Diapherotrites archaeon]|nr:RNA ligase family protein [Candidatus Diapherotrites archaeon]